MPDKPVIDILEAHYRTEDEEKINKWYHEVHIPILFKSKKLREVARYKVIGDSPDSVRYLTICKYDNPKDFEEFRTSPEFDAAGEKTPEMQSVRINTNPPIHCELIKEWIK